MVVKKKYDIEVISKKLRYAMYDVLINEGVVEDKEQAKKWLKRHEFLPKPMREKAADKNKENAEIYSIMNNYYKEMKKNLEEGQAAISTMRIAINKLVVDMQKETAKVKDNPNWSNTNKSDSKIDNKSDKK